MKIIVSFFILTHLLHSGYQSFKNHDSGFVLENEQIIDSEHKFQIIKIDSLQTFYLIYAKRRDSIIKIASEKDTSLNCNPIAKGGFYDFQIKSLFPEKYYQKRDIAGIKLKSVLIKLEGNGIVWDLFSTENLRGLCYVPNCSKDVK